YQKKILSISDRSNVIFTTPSLYLKKELLNWGVPAEKIGLLPNTYDSKLSSVRPTKFLDKTFLRIINVSRMISWKGQKYLILAFAEFLRNHKGHLTLVGGGDELQAMKKLSNELGIS